MNLRIDLSKVTEIRNNGASNQVEEFVEAGRKAYCNLYTNHPTWILVRDRLTLPFVRNTLDNICEEPPPPPPPTPNPFTGGQCSGELYLVEYYALINPANNDFNPLQRAEDLSVATFIPPLLGEITEVVLTGANNAPLTYSSLKQSGKAFRDPLAHTIFYDGGTRQYVFNQQNTWGIEIVNFRRQDGGTECGDPPPPFYPPEAPPAPGDVTNTVNVTNNNNVTNTYNTAVNFDPSGTIVFPPVVTINNSVSVGIDIGGAIITNVTNRPSGGGGGGGEKVFTDVDEPETVEDETELEEEEDPQEKSVEDLVGIRIELVSIPSDGDSTSGRTAQDIVYAGWVMFKNGDSYYPRTFINFAQTRFDAPDDADGYAVTYKKGFSGKITEIVKKKAENIE